MGSFNGNKTYVIKCKFWLIIVLKIVVDTFNKCGIPVLIKTNIVDDGKQMVLACYFEENISVFTINVFYEHIQLNCILG